MENTNMNSICISYEDMFDVGYPDVEIEELQQFLTESDIIYGGIRSTVKDELNG